MFRTRLSTAATTGICTRQKIAAGQTRPSKPVGNTTHLLHLGRRRMNHGVDKNVAHSKLKRNGVEAKSHQWTSDRCWSVAFSPLGNGALKSGRPVAQQREGMQFMALNFGPESVFGHFAHFFFLSNRITFAGGFHDATTRNPEQSHPTRQSPFFPFCAW
jgi:hypothetical protein